MPRRRSKWKEKDIAWDGLPPRRSFRLMAVAASTSNHSPPSIRNSSSLSNRSPSPSLSPPPRSPTPLVSHARSPSPYFWLSHPPHINEDFQSNLDQAIVQINHTQDEDLNKRASRCEELEESEPCKDQLIMEEESIEELSWPPQMLHQPLSPDQEKEHKQYQGLQIIKDEDDIEVVNVNEAFDSIHSTNNDNEFEEKNGWFYNKPLLTANDVAAPNITSMAEFGGCKTIGDFVNDWKKAQWREEEFMGKEVKREFDDDEIGVFCQIEKFKNDISNFGNETEFFAARSKYPMQNIDKECEIDGISGDPKSINVLHDDYNWNQKDITYDHELQEFIEAVESNIFWRFFPKFMQFFEMFWPHHILQAIVMETNRYATVENAHGNTIGGPGWEPFTIPEFKVFLATILYVGMKLKQNIKSCSHKQDEYDIEMKQSPKPTFNVANQFNQGQGRGRGRGRGRGQGRGRGRGRGRQSQTSDYTC